MRAYQSAYFSTPSFIKALTDLSDNVMKYSTPRDKKMFLKQQLSQINLKLPAQVYIPFVSKSMRNYAILNIAIDEAKIFQTKERAPLLLCIEAYRPIEMTMDSPSEVQEQEEFKEIINKEGEINDRMLSMKKSTRTKKKTPSKAKGDEKQIEVQLWSPS